MNNKENRIVIGPSGSGKSFWLNNYILQSYELGRDIMIIDIGGSYRSMIALNERNILILQGEEICLQSISM